MPSATPFEVAQRWLDSRFRISERGSTVSTECVGGLAVFAALAYIFVVNPALLAQAGLDHRQVFYATVVVSGIATVSLGLFANLPLAIAPGMEFNAYLALAVAPQLALGPAGLLGVIAWSGLLFFALTVTGTRATLVAVLYDEVGPMLAIIVGAFLVAVALRVTGLFEYGPLVLAQVSLTPTPQVLAFGLSAVGLLVLQRLGLRGAAVVSIIGSAIALRWLNGGSEATATALSSPKYVIPDLSVVTHAGVWGPILLVTAIDFLGSASKIVALTAGTTASAAQGSGGMRRAMLVDAAGSASAAWLGTSPVTIYVESAAAVTTGARTGLAAVVCGTLMFLTTVFEPLAPAFSATAATGTLFVIGAGIVRQQCTRRGIAFAAIAGALVVLTVVFFAIDLPLSVALLYSSVVALRKGEYLRFRRVGFVTCLVSLLAISRIFQRA